MPENDVIPGVPTTHVKVQIKIRFNMELQLQDAIAEYLNRTSITDTPTDGVAALNIILGN